LVLAVGEMVTLTVSPVLAVPVIFIVRLEIPRFAPDKKAT